MHDVSIFYIYDFSEKFSKISFNFSFFQNFSKNLVTLVLVINFRIRNY